MDIQDLATGIKRDKKSEAALYQQFYEAIRAAILARQFPPGYRLPATRTAARESGVSRNTITAAYDQLAAEGYLETRAGSGTFVSEKIPEEFVLAKAEASP